MLSVVAGAYCGCSEGQMKCRIQILRGITERVYIL